MAKCTFTMPKDFLESLNNLGTSYDEIATACVQAGAEVLKTQTDAELASVLSGESTGELQSSLGMTSVKVDKKGIINAKIGFREPRSDGKSNAMIANVIEYGKHGQRPRPFLKRAKNKAKKDALEAMKAKLTEEISKR